MNVIYSFWEGGIGLSRIQPSQAKWKKSSHGSMDSFMFRLKRAASSRHSAVLHTLGLKFPVVGFGGGVEDVPLLLVSDGLGTSSFCIESSTANNVARMTQINKSIPHRHKRHTSTRVRLLRNEVELIPRLWVLGVEHSSIPPLLLFLCAPIDGCCCEDCCYQLNKQFCY